MSTLDPYNIISSMASEIAVLRAKNLVLEAENSALKVKLSKPIRGSKKIVRTDAIEPLNSTTNKVDIKLDVSTVDTEVATNVDASVASKVENNVDTTINTTIDTTADTTADTTGDTTGDIDNKECESYAEKLVKTGNSTTIIDKENITFNTSKLHNLIISTFHKSLAEKELQTVGILPSRLSTWKAVETFALSERKKNDNEGTDAGKRAYKLYQKYLINCKLEKFPISDLPLFKTKGRGDSFLRDDQIEDLKECYGEYVNLAGDFNDDKFNDQETLSFAHKCAIEYLFRSQI